MRLVDFQPTWVSCGGDGIFDKDGRPVASRERIGISFLCPKCTAGKAEATWENTHAVTVYFENPPDGLPPFRSNAKQPLWQIRGGTTFDDLRLLPSILIVLPGGCGWHGHVGLKIPGEVTTC